MDNTTKGLVALPKDPPTWGEAIDKLESAKIRR